MGNKQVWIIFVFLITGVFLLVANIYGLFTPLRAPEMVAEIASINHDDLLISEDQVYSAIDIQLKKSVIY